MFAGRKMVIATKHRKENVIAPIFEKEFGIKAFVIPEFDTDQFGTFSGEVEREGDPISIARKKCNLAMELSNCDLAISSEGSFGPHPYMFFVPADEEFLFFSDKKNDLEIIVKEISTNTNFQSATISTDEELKTFLKKVKFPTHAVILKNEGYCVKGITDSNFLLHEVKGQLNQFGSVFIETDMRAMHNPMRMDVIAKATMQLVDKIKNCCPSCNWPGYGITDVNPGLLCENCQFPTKSTLSYTYRCEKCSYTQEEKYPHGKKMEDPMYCDICNP
jgi:hypothetical protein